MAAGPEAVVDRIARHVGVGGVTLPPAPKEELRKLGTDKNKIYAERFRAERPEILAAIAKARRRTIDRLASLEGRDRADAA